MTRWLSSGGFLPLETENYVLDIMGEPADVFIDAKYAGTVQPLHPTLKFGEACRKLPVTMSEVVAMSTVHIKPWGVQVAGNIRRAVAVRQWLRVKRTVFRAASRHEPVVSRVRPPSGAAPHLRRAHRRGNRKEADGICSKLRQAGGACVVLKNR